MKLSLDDDGKVQAKLTVDRVRHALHAAARRRTLERAFDQAGLKTSPDSLDFSLRDQGAGARREGGERQGSAAAQQWQPERSLEPETFLSHADIAQLRMMTSAARGGIDRAI